jgi:hypothetical protein
MKKVAPRKNIVMREIILFFVFSRFPFVQKLSLPDFHLNGSSNKIHSLYTSTYLKIIITKHERHDADNKGYLQQSPHFLHVTIYDIYIPFHTSLYSLHLPAFNHSIKNKVGSRGADMT